MVSDHNTATAIDNISKEKDMFSIVESGRLGEAKYYVLVDNDTKVMYLAMQSVGHYTSDGITNIIPLYDSSGSLKLYNNE